VDHCEGHREVRAALSDSTCIAAVEVPSLGWSAPFVALLLCIALLPLIRRTTHWWEHNRNKLLVGLVLGAATLVHYLARDFGVRLHGPTLLELMRWAGCQVAEHDGHYLAGPGLATAAGALGNALFEYVPFMVFLFSLYTISGGIAVRGDIPARPLTNTVILAIGGVLANLIGTTGASMLLIRPLLQTNSERKQVAHTVIFFIFIVSNIGGSLLPIGDPPLFLGYLRGVPFFWTLCLWKKWALVLGALLVFYLAWDTIAYRREAPADVARDKKQIGRIRVLGTVNFLWLILVVAAVATLAPANPLPGTQWPSSPFVREAVQLILVGLSFATTPHGLRHANRFNFKAIGEVACLFIGIFITMQVPLEILNARGAELGLTKAWQFFWATGTLSAFLDNAPTYVVFFQTAIGATHETGPGVMQLMEGSFIRQDLLVGISLGAVFLGAATYIGNGPNFMVKSIAEERGVKMPTFFGYLLYSTAILVPLFVIVTVALL
jgi:Na+/H+ antiporter NhaD/arsenite permease-like protein